MARKLEDFNIFPFIAWTLIICFAAFTFSLTSRLSDSSGLSGDLQEHKASIQKYLQGNP